VGRGGEGRATSGKSGVHWPWTRRGGSLKKSKRRKNWKKEIEGRVER